MKLKLGTIAKNFITCLALASVGSVAFAAVGDYTVKALENSTTGGSGVATFDLIAGQSFTAIVDPSDLWNSGELARWSSANGQNADLYFSSTTDPQVAAWYGSYYGGSLAEGTLIGTNSYFGTWTQNNLTANYGALVGQIGDSSFFLIGTNFSGIASASGQLKLYYFDSNNSDNAGSLSVHVTAVPEPETYAMMLAGLGMIGFMARRRRKV